MDEVSREFVARLTPLLVRAALLQSGALIARAQPADFKFYKTRVEPAQRDSGDPLRP